MTAEDTTFQPSEADARAFRTALGRYATGVTIVTCDSDIGPLGITANSFASVSLDPPLVLWSPARSSKRFAAFEKAEKFAIHILGDHQKDFCDVFSSQGNDFSSLDWQFSAENVPLINDCLVRLECDRHAVHDGGDHAIIVGHVTAAVVREGGSPLVFANGGFGRFSEFGVS